jgi:hypothetical protein
MLAQARHCSRAEKKEGRGRQELEVRIRQLKVEVESGCLKIVE